MTSPPAALHLPFELHQHEHVLKETHRHPVFLWSRVAWMVLLALGATAIALWLFLGVFGLEGTSSAIVWVVVGLWLAFWAGKIYFTWYGYNHDIWVVTDQRLVDAYQKNWVNKRVASTSLVNIQDVSVLQQGILANAFTFGDVRCQTSGTQEHFVLAGVPDPNSLLGLIDSSRDAARRGLLAGGEPGSVPPASPPDGRAT